MKNGIFLKLAIGVLIIGTVFCLVIRGQTPIGVYSTGIPGAVTLPTIPSSFIIYRAGVTNLGNLVTNVAVTFSTPLPPSVGTNYYTSTSINAASISALTMAVISKTTNGFTLLLNVGVSGGVTVDYMAIPYQ